MFTHRRLLSHPPRETGPELHSSEHARWALAAMDCDRIKISTRAPATTKKAADSRELCPPPMTKTSLPRNLSYSCLSEECVTNDLGRSSNVGARCLTAWIPLPTTTHLLASISR